MSKILFLSMYPLSSLDSAPKVRSYFLHKELNRIGSTDLIEGSRLSRSFKLLGWVLSGNIFKNKSIYVESSSSIGSPIELTFLIFARLLNKKIVIFIRDAYPLFPKEFPAINLKQKILYFGWKVSISMYKLAATKLSFPTQALADLFNLSKEKIVLLPPGGNLYRVDVNVIGSNRVGYVGGFSLRYGSKIFIEAILKLRKTVYNFSGVVITRKSEQSISGSVSGIEFREADSSELGKVLEDVDICVIPLPLTQYNKVTLPVKLFDYMSLGKAVVTTGLPEVARTVEAEEIGVVCKDDAEDLAEKLFDLFNNKSKIKTFKENALKSIRERHSWAHRAQDLHKILTND